VLVPAVVLTNSGLLASLLRPLPIVLLSVVLLAILLVMKIFCFNFVGCNLWFFHPY